MTDPVPDSKPPTRWLWVVLIVLLAVAAVIVFLNPTGDAEEEAAIANTNEASGSSLIVTEPSPGAVPVDIPGGAETSAETTVETGAPPTAGD